jgi:hypothetical protein
MVVLAIIGCFVDVAFRIAIALGITLLSMAAFEYASTYRLPTRARRNVVVFDVQKKHDNPYLEERTYIAIVDYNRQVILETIVNDDNVDSDLKEDINTTIPSDAAHIPTPTDHTASTPTTPIGDTTSTNPTPTPTPTDHTASTPTIPIGDTTSTNPTPMLSMEVGLAATSAA